MDNFESQKNGFPWMEYYQQKFTQKMGCSLLVLTVLNIVAGCMHLFSL